MLGEQRRRQIPMTRIRATARIIPGDYDLTSLLRPEQEPWQSGPWILDHALSPPLLLGCFDRLGQHPCCLRLLHVSPEFSRQVVAA